MRSDEFGAFCASIGLEEDACRSLEADHARLKKDPACRALLEENGKRYAAGENVAFYEETEKLERLSENAGVHPYAADLIFYLELAPALKRFYADRGLTDGFFDGAMQDLVCKAHECRTVFGIWGSFVSSWFSLFYRFTLYTIGRLEFCLTKCPCDFEKNGKKIAKGEPCIDVHIPSRGRLTREELDDAYGRAAEFFAPQLKGAPTVFRCESWLLADYHREMLPEGSGIRMFMDDYTIVARVPDTGDLWRIFGCEDVSVPEKLSEDTSLKRAYKKRLTEGLPVYGGVGLFFL